MSPEKWQIAREVFHQALDLAAVDREEYIRKACAGDEELFNEVRSLLDALDDATDFLEDPSELTLLFMKGGEAVGVAESMEGHMVGPYLLLRPLGRGGMGSVYLARRNDDQFEKLVAVKVIKRGMDTDEVIRRFLAERQILAVLDHPNVARLLDGGVTDDGRPYLVMDYVEGRPITKHCDANGYTIEQRLRLFLQMCEAVQYAHRNLIVHRDLKPANILVTPEGSVKLLDFGIAKLVGDAPHSVLETREGVRILTPAYAAPEQLKGGLISTAADVYALGAVLYELLSGRKPLEVGRLSPAEIERIVDTRTPMRPGLAVIRNEGDEESPEAVARNRSVSVKRLQKLLEGDLENILSVALRKEPERRYASVEQFADDVRRYLEGMPVHARADTLVYRTRKFVVRHKWSTSMAAAICMLLAAFVSMLIVQKQRVERERDKAEQLVLFMEDLFLNVDPASGRGTDVTVREVLDAGADRINVLNKYPDKQAYMLDVMGRVYRSLGVADEAEYLLRRSLVIRQAVYGRDHAEVAEALHNLGYLEYTLGNYAAAETLYVEALTIRRRRLGDVHKKSVESLQDLAALYASQGRYNESLQLHEESLEIMKRLPESAQADEAGTHFHIGAALREQGRSTEAEPHIRRALSIYMREYGIDHVYVATTSQSLATLLIEMGRLGDARPLLEKAIAIYRRDLGDEHPWTAFGYSTMGGLERLNGESGSAEHYLRKALETQRRILPKNHPNIATTLVELGELHLDTGNPAAARPLLEEALAIREAALRPGHWRLAEARSALGAALMALGQRDGVDRLLRESYDALLAVRGASDQETRVSYSRLSLLQGSPVQTSALN